MTPKTQIHHLDICHRVARKQRRHNDGYHLFLKQCLDIMDGCEALIHQYVLLLEQYARDYISESIYVADLGGIVEQYQKLIMGYDHLINDFGDNEVNLLWAKSNADTGYEQVISICHNLKKNYITILHSYKASLQQQITRQAAVALILPYGTNNKHKK